MTATLYEISGDLAALEDLLTEVGGELPDEVAEAAIDEWFNECGLLMKDKVDAYCGLIRELESRAAARKAEAKRLADRGNIDAGAVDRLKSRLLWFFEAHQLKTLETARFRVTAAQNGGIAPLHITAPLEEIPDEFIEFVRKPMNPMIRELLRLVSGCRLRSLDRERNRYELDKFGAARSGGARQGGQG